MDGSILDKGIIVNESCKIEPQSIVSCLCFDMKGKGGDYFIQSSSQSNCFEKGSICDLPAEMKIESYQFMGQPNPYKNGAFRQNDNELEDDSEDDLLVEEMSDKKLSSTLNDLVKQISESGYGVDLVILQLKQIKHAYSKDNYACMNAIIPAILNYVAANLLR